MNKEEMRKYQKERYEKSDAHKRVVARREERENNELLGVRVCIKCGEKKDISLFPVDSRRRKCKKCFAKKTREWNRKNPEKLLKMESQRNRFKRTLEKSYYTSKKRGYLPCSATQEEIEKLFSGKCEICGVPEVECSRRLNLDHCHITGQFRGFLCDRCNRVLGHVNDSEEILINALHYLMNFRGAQV